MFLFIFWIGGAAQIPSIPTGLFVSAKGEGCCLMQVNRVTHTKRTNTVALTARAYLIGSRGGENLLAADSLLLLLFNAQMNHPIGVMWQSLGNCSFYVLRTPGQDADYFLP